jgi:transformation/transcription domain-associated protein
MYAGLLQFALSIGGRTPNKILFAKSTGRVYQQDFSPFYDQRLMLEKNEPVPFRLTRNLATFFTPFGVEGNFVTTLSVGAQVRNSTPTYDGLLTFRC